MSFKIFIDNIGVFNLLLSLAAVVSSNTVATIMGYYFLLNLEDINLFIDSVYIQELAFSFLYFITLILIFSRIAVALVQQLALTKYKIASVAVITIVVIFSTYLYTGSLKGSILVIVLSTTFSFGSSYAWYVRTKMKQSTLSKREMEKSFSIEHLYSVIRIAQSNESFAFSIKHIFIAGSFFALFFATLSGYARSVNLTNSAYNLILNDKTHLTAYLGNTSKGAVFYSDMNGRLSVYLVSHSSGFILEALGTKYSEEMRKKRENSEKAVEDSKRLLEENIRALEKSETALETERP